MSVSSCLCPSLRTNASLLPLQAAGGFVAGSSPELPALLGRSFLLLLDSCRECPSSDRAAPASSS